jgi:hypothetical protein
MSILEQLGLDSKLLVAGFSGGAVREFFYGQRSDWFGWVGSTIGGALTSNYVGPFAAHLSGLAEPLAGFVVGAGAVFVLQGILSAVKGWTAKQSGSS